MGESTKENNFRQEENFPTKRWQNLWSKTVVKIVWAGCGNKQDKTHWHQARRDTDYLYAGKMGNR